MAQNALTIKAQDDGVPGKAPTLVTAVALLYRHDSRNERLLAIRRRLREIIRFAEEPDEREELADQFCRLERDSSYTLEDFGLTERSLKRPSKAALAGVIKYAREEIAQLHVKMDKNMRTFNPMSKPKAPPRSI